MISQNSLQSFLGQGRCQIINMEIKDGFCHEGGRTLGQHWLLKQFGLNHPVEHIQKPKLPKLCARVETSTIYFIIHNQFVK